MSIPRSPLLIPALSGANFAIGVGGFVAIGVLIPMAEALSLTEAQAGLVTTLYAVAYVIGSPVGVALTGAWSRRAVLGTGLALFTLGNVLTALAGNVEWLFAARIAAALGAGLVTPVAAGVAAANSSDADRGKALAFVIFGLTLAQVIGMPAATWLGYTFGWEAAFWVSAALGAIAGAVILNLVPAGTVYQVNTFRTLGAALADFRTNFAILFTGSLVGGTYVFYTYTAPILESGMGFDRDGVSTFLLVCGVGAVVGNLAGGPAADRFGPMPVLSFICIGQTAALAVFSFLPLPMIAVYAAGLMWATIGWSFMPAQQIRIVTIAPERQGVTLALNAAALYAGIAAGSAIGGVVISHWGVAALGLTAAAATLASLGHLWWSERLARARA